MAFQSKNTFEPVLRVQVKEVLEHTFVGVIDTDNKLEITITGKSFSILLNILKSFLIDPFERAVPFQRSKNERDELTISLSPVRVGKCLNRTIKSYFFHFEGTHWMRISNNENDSFALIPIFAFDDDYIPLSPVGTPSSEEKTVRNQTNSTNESFPIFRDLTTISETSEISSPRTASFSSNQYLSNRDISNNTGLAIPSRSSPEVHILDVTDLDDPVVGEISKFSFKDPDDKFNIRIYGKRFSNRLMIS